MMSTDTTNDNVKSLHNIKKLDNDGRNYPTWAIRCRMILVGLDLWDVVNPAAQTSTRPTPPTTSASGKTTSTSAPTPAASASVPDPVAEWDRKNSKALAQISLTIDDTPLHIVDGKDTAKDAWQGLADRYNGIGAQDASILTSRLHRFQLDDSKSMESQINQMREMRSQLATLGDVMTDAKFAMVISEALPPLYETLKTLTVATVTDVSKLASDALVTQILREEKRKENQNSAVALMAKTSRPFQKSPKTGNPKSKKGKNRPRCTNPKCKRIGHTFEQCWAEGGSSEGQRPTKSGSPFSGASKDTEKKKEGKVDLLVAHAAVAEHSLAQSNEWIVDSGASSHICANRDWFVSYSPLNPPRPIFLGDKRVCHKLCTATGHVTSHNCAQTSHTCI